MLINLKVVIIVSLTKLAAGISVCLRRSFIISSTSKDVGISNTSSLKFYKKYLKYPQKLYLPTNAAIILG